MLVWIQHINALLVVNWGELSLCLHADTNTRLTEEKNSLGYFQNVDLGIHCFP